MGSYLVKTASNFGLQGELPSHPELLDWLTADFIASGWSTRDLVRKFVRSEVYQQRSRQRDNMVAVDPENRLLWRANRKRLSVEATRDSLLASSGQLDKKIGGRAEQLWGKNYTKRRAVYGFVNRFNRDPTLRVFDFPSPIQTQPRTRRKHRCTTGAVYNEFAICHRPVCGCDRTWSIQIEQGRCVADCLAV